MGDSVSPGPSSRTDRIISCGRGAGVLFAKRRRKENGEGEGL
jgi:hypothetical protein